MTDTPETDSLLEGEGTQCSVNIVKLLDLCRKFEHERNEARDTKWAREIHSCHNECARPMCVLRRERDEAVAAINDCVDWANGREDEWGTRAENSFNFLHCFLAKWETNQPKP
jgi:hypothetical protein